MLPVNPEAEVLRYVMLIARDLRLIHVFFEGHCQQIVKDVNSTQDSATVMCPFIFDIKLLLSLNPHWKVSYFRREANNVAHRLAKFAISCNFETV